MFYMKFFYQKYLYNFLSVFDFNTQNSILFTLCSLKKTPASIGLQESFVKDSLK
jgi:hypothetical protein